MIPIWVQALLWGTVGGAALVLGSAVSWKWRIPDKVVSTIMAFGAGVLITALAFDSSTKLTGRLATTGRYHRS